MSQNSLVSPQASARFVVTLPPDPSRLADALRNDIGTGFTALTDTNDAFRHIALRAKQRLVIMVPFIDRVGAVWAISLFELTSASERILVLRDASQLNGCGAEGDRLRQITTRVLDYSGAGTDGPDETFHAKILLADGVVSYVGSANLLKRSKEVNLECGVLVEGAAVRSIKIVVDAVLATFEKGS